MTHVSDLNTQLAGNVTFKISAMGNSAVYMYIPQILIDAWDM